jgi:acetylornithine/succinyldiaminopimelate/putrescine aminotransferase
VATKRRCEEVGALLVFDETQTGFGRTGRRFAFEHVGVEPHVLVVGEALGAGLFPIAATVYQSRLNDFMNAHPLIHLSTFGGSDLGCAVAIEAVEAYRRQEPWRNAARLGQEALARLSALASGKGSLIRGVAGQGLLVSLDLQSPEAARRLCRRLSDAGVLAAPARVAERCVLLRPALILSDEDLVAMIEAVAQAAQGGAS